MVGIAPSLFLLASLAIGAPAEGAAPANSTAPADSTAPVEGRQPEPEPAWSFTVSTYYYIVPEDRDFLLPMVTADRGGLHLEARHNYEDFETGSLFAGWNFAAGDRFSVELTPMVGGVFGETSGFAPAAKITLGYDRLEFYSEAEYVFDADDSSESFFYSWSELGFAATDRVQAGLIGQRTRAYQTDVEYQRGIWARYSADRLDLTGYVLNLGWDDATVVLAAAVTF